MVYIMTGRQFLLFRNQLLLVLAKCGTTVILTTQAKNIKTDTSEDLLTTSVENTFIYILNVNTFLLLIRMKSHM